MRGLKFKDTFAVEGSELFKLLQLGKQKEAEAHYKKLLENEKSLLEKVEAKFQNSLKGNK